MKIKNKILLITIMFIILFLVFNSNVFATSLETYVYPERENILNNFDVPSEIGENPYIMNIQNEELWIYWIDLQKITNFDRFKIFNYVDDENNYFISACDINGEQITTDYTSIPTYSNNVKNLFNLNIYTISDSTFTLRYSCIASSSTSVSSISLGSQYSSYYFVSSNRDIYDTDNSTLVFQHPLQEKGEQSFQGIIQEMNLEILIQTILEILPKIVIVVVSLVGLLISSQLLWKLLKNG